MPEQPDLCPSMKEPLPHMWSEAFIEDSTIWVECCRCDERRKALFHA